MTMTRAHQAIQVPTIELPHADPFLPRHVAVGGGDLQAMLQVVGSRSLEEFADSVVPPSIRLARELELEGLPADGLGEREALALCERVASWNQVRRSYIGMGYHGTFTPPVILRNVLENPGWYTQYTPYQPEISQGRLEALLVFQTMVSDLTALPLANASLLDEATAAAEAMAMCLAIGEHRRRTFLASDTCHPQTLSVVKTRASALGIRLLILPERCIADYLGEGPQKDDLCGVLLQYPATDGRLIDWRQTIRRVHEVDGLVVMATDLLALTLITPPGELGADIAVGSTQRFGMPMGFGGPHAAFLATKTEYVRRVPGRIIGVSRDARGRPALRMAIQTREQHIRREKATSNICTAQALPAIVAGMYAVYHGPEGLRNIARRVHALACLLARGLRTLGHDIDPGAFFDTLRVRPRGSVGSVVREADRLGMNFRTFDDGSLGIALDETTTREDVLDILAAFNDGTRPAGCEHWPILESDLRVDEVFSRGSEYLTHAVFNTHHTEHQMLRYIFRLMGRDLSLAHSMIPLGSCTMKLNATSEMIPITWRGFADVHPFAPRGQWRGYERIFRDLESWLASITGMAAVSLQPNSGAAGEYAGLMVIRAYLRSQGQDHRRVCLIPESAHGTNPASAVCAGLEVVPVRNTPGGEIDLDDLRAKAREHADRLAAIMVTYPSTYGVYEPNIREVCRIVHEHGGQVYMDGANMNAQVGLTSPGAIGADVCHLNLHKTFCIPHGGGGPGMGPIAVARHLAPFLPGHDVQPPLAPPGTGPEEPSRSMGAVAAAPYGSASILVISWMYIAMMGPRGLAHASRVAMLNANYMARRLAQYYPVLFTGGDGRCAHEFIIDLRPFDRNAGIKPDDVAKRLMDFGFHAPTMSWPVPGTLMIEPTESEDKGELDRFVDAMIAIRREIGEIEAGRMDRANNPLKHAPHTAEDVSGDTWDRPYPRSQGAFPLPWVREHKFWPAVARVDNPWGDRNLICTCSAMSEYA
jgi:glycine dehydrogenase